jgi:hypothetical protein
VKRKPRCPLDLIGLCRSAAAGLTGPTGRRAGWTWSRGGRPGHASDAQTSKKTLEASATEVLTPLVVSVSTMLV